MTASAQIVLTVPASTAYIADVRDFVGKHAMSSGFVQTDIDAIRLSVDEAYTNVIKHAYHFDEQQTVSIRIDLIPSGICISIFDQGIPYNNEAYQAPDIADRIRNRQRGGVGVFLIHKLMDQVEYLQDEGCNVIRMIKRRSVV